MHKAYSSAPNSSDLAEDFEKAILETHKKMYEDTVIENTISTWFKLQELQAYREGILPPRGPVVTRKLKAREKKYRRCLGVAGASDIFKGEGVCILILFKEKKMLRKIDFSEVFTRTCAGSMYS